MKKILTLLTLTIFSFSLLAFDAEAAKRFGGVLGDKDFGFLGVCWVHAVGTRSRWAVGGIRR